MMVKFASRYGKIPKNAILQLLDIELDYVEGTLTQVAILPKPGTKNDTIKVPMTYLELLPGGDKTGGKNEKT